jgi:pimeloyl-ACP methyl ester carboxylesterase
MKGKLSALTLALLASAGAALAGPPNHSTSVVLVHGAFVDGAGWKAVHDELTNDGYEVLVVQNSTETLTGDVAATKRAIADAKYPVVLVGHSYGGAVITEAGGDPKVRSLVYLAAFAPDAGESVQSLLGGFPKDAPPVPIVAKDGFLTLDKDKFLVQFAPDAPRDVAAFMAASQVPWGQAAPATKITVPAWRAKPTYYVVTGDDLIIPPSAQRDMAKRASAKTTEVKSSHAIMISHPHQVTTAIETAAASAN